MVRLETPRLLLRPWQQGDLFDLYAYASDPLVGPPAGWRPHDSLETSRSVLLSLMSTSEYFARAIVLKETEHVVGSITVKPDGVRRNAGARELGYVLAPSCWGQGLMTEAARAVISETFAGHPFVNLMSINHFPENDRSRRVAEKCEMHCDGTLRLGYTRIDNAPADCVCWSLLREEWAALYPSVPRPVPCAQAETEAVPQPHRRIFHFFTRKEK